MLARLTWHDEAPANGVIDGPSAGASLAGQGPSGPSNTWPPLISHLCLLFLEAGRATLKLPLRSLDPTRPIVRLLIDRSNCVMLWETGHLSLESGR